MIPGIAPAISKKKAADPGGGYSFTMTAGDYFGFASGYGGPGEDVGGISNEPIPGQTLLMFLGPSFTNSADILFAGDILDIVNGLTVWVDGIEYAAGNDGWEYDSIVDATAIYWASSGPIFTADLNYFIEIK